MALRLRRGTEAERQLINPVQGELLYVTDQKKVYVGDGTTTGSTAHGVLVGPTALSDDSSPTLGADLNLNGHNITGTGNINITGTITATGNIDLGDDATDAINIGGVITSDIIPAVDDAQDLGSSAKMWANVWTTQVNVDTTLSVGSRIVKLSSGNEDSSAVLWDAESDTVYATTFNGYLDGDVKGSVFTEDSIAVIDGLTGTVTTSTINSAGTRLTVNTTDGTIFTSPSDSIVRMKGLYNGSTQSQVSLHSVRGTISAPQVLQPGDYGVNLNFSTYLDIGGTDVGKSLVSIIPQIDAGGDETDDAPASNLFVVLSAGDGSGDLNSNYQLYTFAKDGSFQSKIVQYIAQDAAKISAITPVAGMVIFDSDEQKFKGYVDDTGLAGGGASNSTPGWVNLN